MSEKKYLTYDEIDGEPLSLFDTEEEAVKEAMECGCGYCEVNYYPKELTNE